MLNGYRQNMRKKLNFWLNNLKIALMNFKKKYQIPQRKEVRRPKIY